MEEHSRLLGRKIRIYYIYSDTFDYSVTLFPRLKNRDDDSEENDLRFSLG